MSVSWRTFRRPAAPEARSGYHVRLGPMRRRHVRHVLRIERQVYPRPWSSSVFASEIAQPPSSRWYVVAQVDGRLVGYAGLWLNVDGGHVTNIAVDPAWQRQGIGARLLAALTRQAMAAGKTAMTLEVRVSNQAAQAMYTRFGFSPAGVRRRYYEGREDAIVMWAHDIDQPAYAERLAAIESELPGTTEWVGR